MVITLLRISRIIAISIALGFLSIGQAFPAAQKDPSQIAEPPNHQAGPIVVKVGVWLIDIDSIDSAAQSFGANVFLRLRWKDQRLAHKESSLQTYNLDDVWSPGLQIVNEVGRVQKTLPEIVQVENDGTVVYKQRYVGGFSQPLQLHDFPFDEQRFRLHFIGTSAVGQAIEFTQDDKLIAAGMTQAAGISEVTSLPDWDVKSYATGPLPYVLTSELQVSGYAFDFIAKRDSRYYIYKVIMPLVLIVLMSWGVFWINPKEAGTQISISTASMLTLIAYRFMVDHLVPKVSYMTRLDEFILGSTFLVFFCLLQVILTSSLMYQGKEALALKTDLLSRFVFPVLFVIVVIVSFRSKG